MVAKQKTSTEGHDILKGDHETDDQRTGRCPPPPLPAPHAAPEVITVVAFKMRGQDPGTVARGRHPVDGASGSQLPTGDPPATHRRPTGDPPGPTGDLRSPGRVGYGRAMGQLHHRTCHLCEAMCGLEITVEGHRITRIRGDQRDPFSRGHVCPKGAALADLHHDPDRLRAPVRRTGDDWERITWNEAFDLVAERITHLQHAYGRTAVAHYVGNPVVHNYGSILHGLLFQRALGTPNQYSATSLDQLPHMLAAHLMFGHQLRLPVPDIDRTHLLIMMGANPAVSNGSLMTAGDVRGALRGIRDRGGRVVVIDPRQTETARWADEHHFIRPGTDAALLAAVARHILDAHGPRLGRLAPHIDGVEALTRAVAPFSLDRVAKFTGISADSIRSLGDDLVTAPSAVLYGRLGVCTQPFGGLAAWLINAVNLIAGRFDTPGGAMFTTPAVDLPGLSAHIGKSGSFATRQSRVRGWPEFGGELPTPTLADEILTPGAGQVRGLITSAGNPVLSSPGGTRLERGLEQLEFMASIDIYINETTRYADVILPPTFGLEHDHYDIIFHLLAVRNSAKYSPSVWPRSPDQRHDWEIYTQLSRRIERRRAGGGWRWWRRRALDPVYALLERVEPSKFIDLMLRGGPHRLSLRQLLDSPHGIDLGPLQPRLPDILSTPGRRIVLAPSPFINDLPRLVRRIDEAPAEPIETTRANAHDEFPSSNGQPSLTLIGRRNLRSNNSWMHNSRRLVKGRPTCTLLMHPDDAERLDLIDGQSVRVATETGAVVVPLEVDDRIMRGVVSLPHGWGHHRVGVRLRVASERPGASSNDVIRPDIDPLTGTACLNAVQVNVTAT